MDVEINNKRENPLLQRTEVTFRVHHPGTNTPTRQQAASLIKNELNTGNKVVIIDHLESEFGRAVTSGYAKVYANQEVANSVEREYMLERNKAGSGGAPAAEAKPAPEPEPAAEAEAEAADDAEPTEEDA